MFERYVNFEFYKTHNYDNADYKMFERYVNFEFYKTDWQKILAVKGLRDM